MVDQERTAFAVLSEPRRRTIFDVVVRAGHAVTRDDVVAATGIERALVAHHLDRLAEAGLLVTSFARRSGVPAGRGAGRPAKYYAAAAPEVLLSVPPRRYELAARILARALLDPGPTDGGSATESVRRAAHEEGRRIGAEHGRHEEQGSHEDDGLSAIAAVLGELGYEPRPSGDGLRLANCPFHALLDVSVELTCGANHAFCSGLVDGLGLEDVPAVLDPEPGPECCVRLGG